MNKKKSICYRKTKNTDYEKLNSDFESAYNELKNDSHIDTAFTTYQEKVSEIFNNHAPLKKSIIIARPNTKWYSEKIRQEKTKRRRLERKINQAYNKIMIVISSNVNMLIFS